MVDDEAEFIKDVISAVLSGAVMWQGALLDHVE
jgi:hypothetical protein